MSARETSLHRKIVPAGGSALFAPLPPLVISGDRKGARLPAAPPEPAPRHPQRLRVSGQIGIGPTPAPRRSAMPSSKRSATSRLPWRRLRAAALAALPLLALGLAGASAQNVSFFRIGTGSTAGTYRSEEHTSELQSLMSISY